MFFKCRLKEVEKLASLEKKATNEVQNSSSTQHPPTIKEEDIKSSVLSEMTPFLDTIQSRQESLEGSLASLNGSLTYLSSKLSEEILGLDRYEADSARTAAIIEHITDELLLLKEAVNSEGTGEGR